jgi:Ydr279p protein family (RNase H2 complex component) wHTH domain/Ydr279p protein triple barrel domain
MLLCPQNIGSFHAICESQLIMGVQTRASSSNSPIKAKAPAKVILPTADEEPQKVFVLPSQVSRDARLVLLRNPRDGARSRYFFCPENGLYEITRVNAAALDPRSILFAPDTEDRTSEMSCDAVTGAGPGSQTERKAGGYVNKSAEMFVATPFDPVFILLPLLDRPSINSKADSGKSLFKPFDDLVDEQLDDDRHLCYVLTNLLFRPMLLNAMDQICDSVDAGDEQVFRLSMPKLSAYMLQKAKSVVQKGLPASLEERFVTRALEVPMLSIKREESTVSSATESNEVASGCVTPDVSESQSSAISTSMSVAVSEASSATSDGVLDNPPSSNLLYLQRLRTVLSFITAAYLEPNLATKLTSASHESNISPDFSPLDEHLKHLTKLRAEALAARSMSDFSKKRNLDDDEAAEERVEKKRKQEEEEKKKKSQESRGVRDLKKVNVSGMKKMSDFFAKKAPTAKPKS